MSHVVSSRSQVSGEILTVTLIALAATTWWLTSSMSQGMSNDSMMAPMSLAAFLLAWVLMMTAMMLPAVTPVVRLYQRAAAAGQVAPTVCFVGAYLVVWALTGLPAYLLWRVFSMPVTDGDPWALRLAGATLLFAGAYQLTPLKRACLRHCRSPMSYFMRLRGSMARPGGAFRAGGLHAAYCCGCCGGLMIVLVAAAAMSLWWTVSIAIAVFIERNLRWGAEFSIGFGLVLVALGASVLVSPSLLPNLI